MRERLRLAARPLHCLLLSLVSSASLAAYGGLGCASSAGDGAKLDPSPSSGGSSATGTVVIKFLDPPLELAPREQRELQLVVTPARAHHVQLTLLGAESAATAPDDAALDHAEVETNAAGLARVVLTAPSAPTTFALRAQVGSASATLPITMSSTALLTLILHPRYEGRRAFSGYTATAYPGVSCVEIAPGMAPNAGLLVRANPDAPLELVDVPAAAKIAVVVSAGSVARGCTTVQSPLPRADTDVSVELKDVAINLAETKLDTLFALEAGDTAFADELTSALSVVTLALRNDAESELSAVLDAMAASLSGSRRTTFDDARSEASWDTRLASAGAEPLSKALERWSEQARPALSARTIEAKLAKNDDQGATPSLTLSRIGDAPAADIELSVDADSWATDTSDTLALAASVSWPASSLLTALVAAPARAETGLQDVAAALSQVLGCQTLGERMTGGDEDSVVAFAQQCDAACATALCDGAVDALWQAARAASGSESTQLSLQVSGAATLGAKTQIVSLSGNWVGRLSHGDEETQTGGAFAGFAPRE